MKMRVLLCAFFWLTAVELRRTASADEFYPTPIPLDDWHPAARSAREDPEPAPAPPASPAPYWEDALRHSVYLTMVRDKIDQLIDQDASHQTNEAVDDHDLWDRIKYAPFDRIQTEQPAEVGDLTTMAKGRLMEENGRYRFTEDDEVKACSEESCMKGATALWAVRRVRQRDAEPSGRYHYELTFSVITGPSKRQRKPHENPARTFTVRETAPETIVDAPHEFRPPKDNPHHRIRPGRALWVHKNIVPAHKHQPRHYRPHDTDRLFTSLFMDDDYEAHRRPAAPHSPPAYSQYSKVGYVGSPSSHYHYKKYTPYSYKQHQTPIKYSKPSVPYPQIPPQHHYLDIDAIGVVSAPYVPQPDTRYYVPNKVVKTTRPPVLPTPVQTPSPSINSTDAPTEMPVVREVNATYTTNQAVEPIVVHSKPRPNPVKISYFNDHLRPPVYNAPPGVFVTMDKKPFKPLPPLKLHSSLKTIRPSKPLDFRPSPQLLDIQFSEPDPLFDGAFRPITVNYAQRNGTETTESKIAESSKTKELIVEKDIITDIKIPKKNKKKSQRVTTTTTSTVAPTTLRLNSSTESDYDLSWGNLLGAFAKTTPMNAHTEKFKLFDSGTIVVTTTSTTTTEPTTTTTTEAFREEPTTTTVASTTVKRTRPPPVFQNVKTNKIRKHKRVTTTTTTSPLQVTPLKPVKIVKVSNDLTPQASSAASSGTRTTGRWTPSSTTTTTTTPKPSTTVSTNTITGNYENSKTITTLQPQIVTASSKKQNRYRQSTLMYKGTSVKHDKWSIINNNILATTKPTVQPPPRRIESNFQGYTKSNTSPHPLKSLEDDDYDDYELTTTTEQQKVKSSSDVLNQQSESVDDNKTDFTQEINEPIVNTVSEALHYKRKNEDSNTEDYNEDENDEHETNSESIYSFYLKSTTPMTSKPNEIEEEIKTTEITGDNSTAKTKKKCKRKNVNSTLTTLLYEQPTSSVPPTTISTSSDIYDELFSSFTSEDEDKTSTAKDIDSISAGSDNEMITKADDFLNFLNLPNYTVLDKDNNDEINEDDEYNDDLDEDDEFDDHDSGIDDITKERSQDDDVRESRDIESTDHPRPYSIFELMSMD